MNKKQFKVRLIKEYIILAENKEEAIESAKFKYDYDNDSSYLTHWDNITVQEYVKNRK